MIAGGGRSNGLRGLEASVTGGLAGAGVNTFAQGNGSQSGLRKYCGRIVPT